MPAARPKKENLSATPPSDDGRLKDSHAENGKSKRKYVCECPSFLRRAFISPLHPALPTFPHIGPFALRQHVNIHFTVLFDDADYLSLVLLGGSPRVSPVPCPPTAGH